MTGPNRLMVREGRRDDLADALFTRYARTRSAAVAEFEALVGASPSEAITSTTYAVSPLDQRPFGIDVSRFNPVDWSTVGFFGPPSIRFAIVRSGQAHQGAYDWVDNRVFYNWHNARRFIRPETITLADGTVIDSVQLYHVVYPASPIMPQVQNALRIIRLLGGIKHGPLWIDMELAQGMTGAQILDKTGEMIWRLQQALGIPVGDYTGKWFIDRYRLPVADRPWCRDIWWWLAQYGLKGEPTSPLLIPEGIPPARVMVHQTLSTVEGMLFGGYFGSRVDGDRLLVPVAI